MTRHIATKLIAGFAILVFFMAAVGYISQAGLREQQRRYGLLLHHEQKELADVLQVESLFYKATSALMLYFLNNNTGDFQRFYKLQEEQRALLDSMERRLRTVPEPDRESLKHVLNIRRDNEKLREDADSYFTSMTMGDAAGASDKVVKEVRPRIERAAAELQKWRQSVQERTQAELQQIALQAGVLQAFTMLLIIVSVIIVLGIGIWLVRSITTPLVELAEAAEIIEQGKHDQVIPQVRTGDEIERLAGAFQRMVSKLIGLYHNTRDQSRKLEEEIAERRRAEEALRESEAKFRSLAETVSAVIFIVDRGRFVYVNNAAIRMSGYSRDELLTMDPLLLVHPAFRAAVKQYAVPRRRGGRTPPLSELQIVTRDRRERWIAMTAGIIRFGSRRAILGTAFDITERKRDEAEITRLNEDLEHRLADLAAVNKELESFSYSVSHDLRAPLRSIEGFSQALLEDYGRQLDDTARDYLTRVNTASHRMAQLIDDLLNLSRVTRYELHREKLDLGAIVENIAAELQRTNPQRRVTFKIARDVIANADPHLLRIALENLVDNAWKFTSKHPTAHIEFGVITHAEKPIYYLHDDGAGFDMSYANKLFGAFQRLHSDREFSGTGVGLATVQRIIHRHGGYIWAEGAVEQGCTFYFTL